MYVCLLCRSRRLRRGSVVDGFCHSLSLAPRSINADDKEKARGLDGYGIAVCLVSSLPAFPQMMQLELWLRGFVIRYYHCFPIYQSQKSLRVNYNLIERVSCETKAVVQCNQFRKKHQTEIMQE